MAFESQLRQRTVGTLQKYAHVLYNFHKNAETLEEHLKKSEKKLDLLQGQLNLRIPVQTKVRCFYSVTVRTY